MARSIRGLTGRKARGYTGRQCKLEIGAYLKPLTSDRERIDEIRMSDLVCQLKWDSRPIRRAYIRVFAEETLGPARDTYTCWRRETR